MKPKPIEFGPTAPLCAKVVSAFPGFLINESFYAVVYLRCLDVKNFVWGSKVFLFKFSLNLYLSVSLIYEPISWNSCWPQRNDCFWKILIILVRATHKEFTHTGSLNPSRPPLMVDLSSLFPTLKLQTDELSASCYARTWADRAGVRKVYPVIAPLLSRPRRSALLDRISAHSSDTTFALSSAKYLGFTREI